MWLLGILLIIVAGVGIYAGEAYFDVRVAGESMNVVYESLSRYEEIYCGKN